MLMVVDQAVGASHGGAVRASLGPDRVAGVVEITAEEPLKRMSTVERIWQACLQVGLDRSGAIIAVGGGLTGDVAGFAAASFMRGVDVVQIPTTLLSMVDASIGGKTGINVPLPGSDRLGKNLAGAFWAPKLVLVDPETLETLPRRELRSGLAECVKHGVIADRGLLALIGSHAELLAQGDRAAIDTLLPRSIEVKRAIVQADEHERGSRMLLNLGHTFAHAIEPITDLDLTHGEAVAIGMCAAAWCAEGCGLCSIEDCESLTRTLSSLGLPTSMPRAEPIDALCDAMRYDKKATGDRLRLVLPTRDAAVVRDDVPPGAVREAWQRVMPEG
jgi:3-dehydroquinate synthase